MKEITSTMTGSGRSRIKNCRYCGKEFFDKSRSNQRHYCDAHASIARKLASMLHYKRIKEQGDIKYVCYWCGKPTRKENGYCNKNHERFHMEFEARKKTSPFWSDIDGGM